jgi:hypothetical protein
MLTAFFVRKGRKGRKEERRGMAGSVNATQFQSTIRNLCFLCVFCVLCGQMVTFQLLATCLMRALGAHAGLRAGVSG